MGLPWRRQGIELGVCIIEFEVLMVHPGAGDHQAVRSRRLPQVPSCWRRPIKCGHGPGPEVGTEDPAVTSPSPTVVPLWGGHGQGRTWIVHGRKTEEKKRTKGKTQGNTSAYGGIETASKGP